MREIPTLQSLCLRSIGSHSCSTEATFRRISSGESECDGEGDGGSLSTASRLLRSYSKRPTTRAQVSAAAAASAKKRIGIPQYGTSSSSSSSSPVPPQDKKRASKKQEMEQEEEWEDPMSLIPMDRTPCIGNGSARRFQANEVDLHHPVVACLQGEGDEEEGGGDSQKLIMWHGSAALDALQSYIDSLVEMGRMDDGRLGRRFWEEWKAAIRRESADDEVLERSKQQQHPSAKKRPRRQTPTTSGPMEAIPEAPPVLPPSALGALSLHNCVLGEETFEQMRKAGLAPYLAVLDLTGVRGLTDNLLLQLLPSAVNLRQLSLKNCRRITAKTLRTLVEHVTLLESLDVGGAFNLRCDEIVSTFLPDKLPRLTALHASGLGWNDESLRSLVEGRVTWTQLSLGFSTGLSQPALKMCLGEVADSLSSLALPFCETVVDNAALGLLGRNLPNVVSLDVRGNPLLNTLTGWYDGRVSADLPAQRLVVLGRYSGLSESSVEETRRQHPLDAHELVVFLDGGGMGAGITRTQREENGAVTMEQ